MHVLITRPVEDGEETAALLRARGHQAMLAPLLTTRFHDGPEPELAQVQAILATSANGVRAFARRSARRNLPVFAVGPQTAQAARDAGFARVKSADGDARALARKVPFWTTPVWGILLHATSDQGAGTLADDNALRQFTVRREVLYTMEHAAHLPTDAAAALRAGALNGVLLYSPISAQIFRACVLRQALPTDRLTAFCISPATRARLEDLPLADIRIAHHPNQDALLALVE